MSGPAATVGSMHVCPMCNPNGSPHVGGPVSGPGVPTVLIGGKPAAVMGDMCTCAGPPDMIAQGEATVLIGGKAAATVGSMTAHGGSITVGDPTVLIGTGGSGATAVMAVKKIPFPKITPILKTMASLKGRGAQLRDAAANQEALRKAAQEEEEVSLSNLVWKKDASQIYNVSVGDTVALTADVQGLEDGRFISLRIYEKDQENEDDFVASVAGQVENGAIELLWNVVYIEDLDDIDSAQELQEKEYTLPEYVFKYDNSNGETVESNIIEVKDVLELKVIDLETDEPLANANFTIALPNGELLEGTLDADGYALVEDLSSSKKYPIVFYTNEDVIGTAKY